MSTHNLEEDVIMDKSNTLARAMAILNEGGILIFGSYEYKAAAGWISSMINEMGPERTLEKIRYTKARLIAETKEASL